VKVLRLEHPPRDLQPCFLRMGRSVALVLSRCCSGAAMISAGKSEHFRYRVCRVALAGGSSAFRITQEIRDAESGSASDKPTVRTGSVAVRSVWGLQVQVLFAPIGRASEGFLATRLRLSISSGARVWQDRGLSWLALALPAERSLPSAASASTLSR